MTHKPLKNRVQWNVSPAASWRSATGWPLIVWKLMRTRLKSSGWVHGISFVKSRPKRWRCWMPRYSFQPLSMTSAFLSTVSSPWPTTSLLSVGRAFSTVGQLRSIRHSLTSEAMLTLTQAFVSSRLDYCNSVLAGVSSQLLQKMQVIQNAAARFVMGARRRDHMIPVLRELLWLPVRQRIWFKTAVMVYKYIQGLAPSYLASHCEPTSSCPGRSYLRSAMSGQLNFPRTETDYGKRSFAVNGPVACNSLPASVTWHLARRFQSQTAVISVLTADLAHLVYLF